MRKDMRKDKRYESLHAVLALKEGERYKTELEKFVDKIDKIIEEKKSVGVVEKSLEVIEQYLTLLKREFLIEGYDLKEIKNDFIDAMKPDTPKAFLFGAGISMGKPFNLPSWTGLLQNAVLGTFYKDYDASTGWAFDDFLRKVTSRDEENDNYFNSFDLYELGQFIEDNLQRKISKVPNKYYDGTETTDGEMCEIVGSSLTYNMKKSDRCKERNGKYALMDDNDLNGTFLQYLCRFASKYNINRIITYNYDNAFEYAYNAMLESGDKELFPVFVDEQLPSATEKRQLPVYHVHGYIPILDEECSNRPDVKKQLEENPDAKKLVLSEASYDDIAHSSYKWRNTVQIDTFLRYNCIFFGFSATDVNFKRIVKLMDWHSEQFGRQLDQPVKHYIFLTVNDFINNIFGTSIERLVEKEDDLTVLCSTNMYEKRFRRVCMRLVGDIKAIMKDGREREADGIIKTPDEVKLKDLSKFFYENDDLSVVDKAMFEKNAALLFEIADRINEVAKIEPYKNIASVNHIKSSCEDILNILSDMHDFEDPDLSLLSTRLQYLYFTLRMKRRYLIKYHIYPIWTSIKDSRYYIDAVLK